jgi:hypothetical protein
MNIEEKLIKQQEEQYLSIGKFVVKFEHLNLALKNKLEFFVGNSEELKILVEPQSFRISVDFLKKIIAWRTKHWPKEHPDIKLYNNLITDLNNLNNERNSVIHTTWFIGWRNDKTTDMTDFVGFKYSTTTNFKSKKLSAKEIDKLTQKCEILYRVFYTVWSIDNLGMELPVFSKIWKRDSPGNWIDLRK